MQRLIAELRKPAVATLGAPRRRLADNIRFAAGLAITCGGAIVSLSDLAALVAPVG